jgi:hypothetical protein
MVASCGYELREPDGNQRNRIASRKPDDRSKRLDLVRITNDKTKSLMVVTGLIIIQRLLHRKSSARILARDGL